VDGILRRHLYKKTMDIRLLEEKQNSLMNEMVGIVNPSSHDFTCTHDSNSDHKPITYTIKSRQGLMLKRYIADHISFKLCTEILSSNEKTVSQELFDKTLKTIRLYD
jgi:hypothetical protein